MKKNIFDLLDDYTDDSVVIEEVSPLSEERIRRMTMGRVPKRTAKQRWFSRLPATALAALLLSVSVFAAAGALGAGKWFRDFFGPLTAGQDSEIDAMSRELAIAAESGGAVITPLAVLVDENVCYLRLRVEAPAGTVLGALPAGYSYKLYGGIGSDQLRFEPANKSPYARKTDTDGTEIISYGYGYGVAEYDLPDADPTDNSIETVLRITANQAMAEKSHRFNDGMGKRITIGGLWIMTPDIEFEQVFLGDFSFEFDSSFESHALPLDCAGASWQDAQGVTYALDAAMISPLTLSFHYASDLSMPEPFRFDSGKTGSDINDDRALPQPNAFSLILTDGTVIDCGDMETGSECTGLSINEANWQPCWSLWDCVIFTEPLDLSLLDHVQYGDASLYLHSVPVDLPPG